MKLGIENVFTYLEQVSLPLQKEARSAKQLHGRNFNYKVCAAGACFLVKQFASSSSDYETLSFVEASWAYNCPGYAIAPSRIDISNRISVYPFFSSDTLLDAVLTGSGSRVERIFDQLCRAIYLIRKTVLGAAAFLSLPAGPPWVTSLALPSIQILRDCSPGKLAVIREIQSSPSLRNTFAHVASGWAGTSLIHADVRPENILCSDDEVRIIDWEHAQLGDSAWDVAGLIATFLVSWLLAQPVSYADRLRVESTPVSRSVCRAVAALRDSSDDLVMLDAMVSAQLVKAAYEAAAHASELHPPQLLLLQMAQNVAARGLADFV